MVDKMFENAVRGKYRFPFRGAVSVEDLFDLTVESLDSIYKVLNSDLKQITEESLLETKTSEDKELDEKIEIVKYIVKTKLEEQNLRLKETERSAQKQKILGIISAKQDESLQSKSEEELKEMLDKL